MVDVAKLVHSAKEKRLPQFLTVGAIGAVVNMFVLFALTDWAGFYYLISYCFAFCTSVSTNYVMNSFWTFKDKRWSLSGLGRYAITTLIALPVGGGFLFLLVDFAGMWYLIANAVLIASAAMINFTLSRRFVWNQQRQ